MEEGEVSEAGVQDRKPSGDPLPKYKNETPSRRRRAWILEKHGLIKESLERAGEEFRLLGEPFQLRPSGWWTQASLEVHHPVHATGLDLPTMPILA